MINYNQSILLSKKFEHIPERLFYKISDPLLTSLDFDKFIMIETKNHGHKLGYVEMYKETQPKILCKFFPKDDLKPSICISNLQVEKGERHKGVGSDFIKFAKMYSRKNDCDGRLHLFSSDVYDSFNPPHVFYRKQEFSSKNEVALNKIDYMIKQKIQYPCYDFQEIPMYYNPKRKTDIFESEVLLHQKSLKAKIIDALKIFFS